jgi:arylsulfatase A-like enzyme
MSEAFSATGALDKPNILLICTDHWPGLLTRPAGHPVVMTSAIAQLACCGAHYTNAYSACLSARRSLITGTT